MEDLIAALIAWVTIAESNGVRQGTAEWHEARKYRIGGSSLPALMGINPYNSVTSLLREKCGVDPFRSAIAMWWGNLFEDVIKRWAEYVYNCKIYAENAYILHSTSPAISYSPDGMAVIDLTETSTRIRSRVVAGRMEYDMVETTTQSSHITLLEFKCPYSRTPTTSVPEYYIPQILMGLDMLPATRGLFIQAMFRRCTWAQLGMGPGHDRSLVDSPAKGDPICYGLIGMMASALSERLMTIYREQFLTGCDESDDVNDLGACDPKLFTAIMEELNAGNITAWYGPNRVDAGGHGGDEDLAAFREAAAGSVIVGMLPYKLLKCCETIIAPQPGYLKPWISTMEDVIAFVRRVEGLSIDERAAAIERRTSTAVPDDQKWFREQAQRMIAAKK